MVAATPELLFLSAGLIVIGGKKRMPGETMQVRGWGGPLVIVVASLWAAALPPRPAGAEGAIALGQTDSISADGLAFGTHYNDFDPNRGAGLSVAECTLSQAPEPAHKACKIIGTFHDRCFALAQDAPTGKQSALKDLLGLRRETGEGRTAACEHVLQPVPELRQRDLRHDHLDFLGADIGLRHQVGTVLYDVADDVELLMHAVEGLQLHHDIFAEQAGFHQILADAARIGFELFGDLAAHGRDGTQQALQLA
jgi:hypothetical protein